MSDVIADLADYFITELDASFRPRECKRGHVICTGNVYIVRSKRDGLLAICATCQRERSRRAMRAWRERRRAEAAA